MSVLEGNGDGTFLPAINFTVGAVPLNVAIGDLNGDGKLDLVTANNSSDDVSVLLNEVSPEQAIQNQIDVLQGIVADPSTDPELAVVVQDAIAEAQDALNALAQTPPDGQVAEQSLGEAEARLQAAVDDGLLDPDLGTQLMDQFAGVARQIATDALAQAIDQEGDPVLIAGAQQALADGDALRASEEFEAAVDKYEVALADAKDALL